jgi:hypothetical protein
MKERGEERTERRGEENKRDGNRKEGRNRRKGERWRKRSSRVEEGRGIHLETTSRIRISTHGI